MIPSLIIVILLGISQARAIFYKAYFDGKQRSIGKDPRDVMKKEFPLMWWIF